MVAHHTFVDYMGVQVPGWIVPQQAYSAAGTPDFRPRPTIRFTENGMPGMRLKRALELDFRASPDGSQHVILNETGTKIAMRVLWPGYPAWSQHIHVYDHTSARQPITKAKLAHDIARLMKLFYDDMLHNPSTEPKPDWWVSNMKYEELVVLELRNVSPGSWQPVICRAYH